MKKIFAHNFHIPVMGTGYTIDTPIKVAQYGISSVISIVDDSLIEKMRELYCTKFNFDYKAINESSTDYRAERITSYLNLVDKIVSQKVEKLKDNISEKNSEINNYINLLPNFSELKQEFKNKFKNSNYINEAKEWFAKHSTVGSIDVNIMTKVDKTNYKNKEELPLRFNDAHAALRGFALSKLKSSLVLSAGMNPRLYAYIEQFNDFYPNADSSFNKKITLKVSDYRSALIQGQYLAKRGIWISEYRIESGLNCGGHAFATDGNLMGPILEEFKSKKKDLVENLNVILKKALIEKGKVLPSHDLDVKISAQGGVGSFEEHKFLSDYYNIDSIGWGSPFLLCPDVCDIEDTTLKQLSDANEDTLKISYASPLGVKYNNLIGNTRDAELRKSFLNNKPGSVCTKRYMVSNTEYTERAICTASREFQKHKMEDLKSQNLEPLELDKQLLKMTEKTCLCRGLASSTLEVNKIQDKTYGEGVSICPGPNLAYFDKITKLTKMIDHIYGRTNLISRNDRPHMFINELKLYVEHMKEKFEDISDLSSKKEIKSLTKFKKNILEGIEYYKLLANNIKTELTSYTVSFELELEKFESQINEFKLSKKESVNA